MYGLIAIGVVVSIFYILVGSSVALDNKDLEAVCTETIWGNVNRVGTSKKDKTVTVTYTINGEEKTTSELEDKFDKFKWSVVEIHYNPNDLTDFYFGKKPDPAFSTGGYTVLVFSLIGMLCGIVVLIRYRRS